MKMMMKIKEITLLSYDDYSKYRHLISKIKNPWWLRSAPNETFVYSVLGSGFLFPDLPNQTLGVRPALICSDLRKKPEEKIDIFGYIWTVLDYNLALCDSIISEHNFDYDAVTDSSTTEWNESRLKETIEMWYYEQVNDIKTIIHITNKAELDFLKSFCKKYDIVPFSDIFFDKSDTDAYFAYLPYRERISMYVADVDILSEPSLSFEKFCDYYLEKIKNDY